MDTRVRDTVVKAPGELVITAYCGCTDIRSTITPDLKQEGNDLLYIDLGGGHNRLGGTALAQCFSQLGDSCPDVDSFETLVAVFDVTQELIKTGCIESGHDRSDGGLITTLCEMAFSGNRGLKVNIDCTEGDTVIQTLFNEELGLVLETQKPQTQAVMDAYNRKGVDCKHIGIVLPEEKTTPIQISVNHSTVFDTPMADLRNVWEATSFELEKLQSNKQCVEQEQIGLQHRHTPQYYLTFEPQRTLSAEMQVKAAVLRSHGTTGDREMCAALYMANIEPWDVTTGDLLDNKITLERFQLLVIPGGFSYGDVLGTGRGFAATLSKNPHIYTQLESFRERRDTHVLGVGNGAQVLAELGWVGDSKHCRFKTNQSGRFESRWATVTIKPSVCAFLTGMEGSTMGVWVAHGEGRCTGLKQSNLAPIVYADDLGHETACYPASPNGGIEAAMISADGRCLAMIPHPERSVLSWQMPWQPSDWKCREHGPCIQLFQNMSAYYSTN